MCVPVRDVTDAAGFYRALGFAVETYDDGYAWVTHAGREILHLARPDGFDRQANRAAAYFHVQDAAAWHAAWSAGGADVTPVVDQPWEMREFALTDPDGNRIRVGQNLTPTAT